MWKKMLKAKELSKEQEKVIAQYEQNPQGRSFLAMGQLLYSFGFEDEAVEMLMAGVATHPHYSVARFFLVRYLWQRGLFVVAWKVLQDPKRGSMENNVLAWSLTLKLALVLGYESHARTALASLRALPAASEELQELMQIYHLSGRQKAKAHLLAAFDDVDELQLTVPHPAHEHAHPGQDDPHPPAQNLYPSCAMDVPASVKEFHAVSLGEIFTSAAAGSAADLSGVELDSLTLAEIFEKQHCFGRALEIYRRLMIGAPSHDGLRKKVLLLQKKLADETRADLTDVDGLIDSLEDRQALQRKAAFLERLLAAASRKLAWTHADSSVALQGADQPPNLTAAHHRREATSVASFHA